ncbi:MAG: hypothetical protein GXO55_07665 [Chloroflexi bacterium]|nr:hypothetical protein [Chloroflexota bacterium]
MGILLPFLLGFSTGATGGFLVGLWTADEDNPAQENIRAFVRHVWEEARRAAHEEEQRRLQEFQRMTGL